jgi:hypothetical protein
MSEGNFALGYRFFENEAWSGSSSTHEAEVQECKDLTPQLLGVSCYRKKKFTSALRLLEGARACGELDNDGKVLLIQLYLLTGAWRKGWEFLGECCRRNAFVPPIYSLPRWSGQPLRGKRIVVWGGGGLGDEILYVRYLPRLSDLGAEVYLDCSVSLVGLFRSLRGVHRVGNFEGEEVPADYQITTAELPMHFGAADGCTWPEPGPYLHADPLELPRGGLRVGIVWAADLRHPEGAERTTSLADMACLGSVSEVRLYNLQVGPFAKQLNSPPAGMTILPLSLGFPTFAEQAGQIRGLDLVVTVDTAVANLAGALGVRTWVAAPEIPNWRWGRTGVSTPWYPTTRIYRQPSPGDWRTVFANIARDLAIVRLT